MTWENLFNKIGKQPIKITNKNEVNVMINGEKILLDLKFDKENIPYFIIKPQQKVVNNNFK